MATLNGQCLPLEAPLAAADAALLETRDHCEFRDPAFASNRNAPIHRWAPWIAGFSKQFVEDALERHAPAPSVVLDPFAGVGTTLLEADLAGHEAVGFEINPYAAFVARVKLAAHRIDARRLRDTMHPGRAWASQLRSVKTQDAAEERVRAFWTPPVC